jgi:hypothetical protein
MKATFKVEKKMDKGNYLMMIMKSFMKAIFMIISKFNINYQIRFHRTGILKNRNPKILMEAFDYKDFDKL